jgi:hypothetical protein
MIYGGVRIRQGQAVNKEITRRLRLMFREIELGEGRFVIGRSQSCDLPLEDPLVSRRHACILSTEVEVTVEDLGSRNGTLLNGEPLFDKHPLHHRDRIGIGNHELFYFEDRRCAAARLPSNVDTEIRRPQRAFESSRAEDTISLQMGGGSSTRVRSIIDKAMRAGQFEHAARLLDGKLEDYAVKAARGVHDIALLAEIAPLNAQLAAELKDGSRIAWILAAYARSGTVIPEVVLAQLLEAARGWYNVAHDIEGCLRALEGCRSSCETADPVLQRMREILRSCS